MDSARDRTTTTETKRKNEDSTVSDAPNKRAKYEVIAEQHLEQHGLGDTFPPLNIRLAYPYRDTPTPLGIQESSAPPEQNNDNNNNDVLIIDDDDDYYSISSGNTSGTEYVPDEDEMPSNEDKD